MYDQVKYWASQLLQLWSYRQKNTIGHQEEGHCANTMSGLQVERANISMGVSIATSVLRLQGDLLIKIRSVDKQKQRQLTWELLEI